MILMNPFHSISYNSCGLTVGIPNPTHIHVYILCLYVLDWSQSVTLERALRFDGHQQYCVKLRKAKVDGKLLEIPQDQE